MGLLMLIREPYVSSTSDKPQLNIRMHQTVEQSITKQAASTGFVGSVGTATGQPVLGHVMHVRG